MGFFGAKESQTIAWKILREQLPTRDNLKKRNIIPLTTSSECVVCGEVKESIPHLFFVCSFARYVWSKFYQWIDVALVSQPSRTIHFLTHSEMFDPGKITTFTSTMWTRVMWTLWNLHNDLIFNAAQLCPIKAFNKIKAHMWCWFVVKENSFSSCPFAMCVGPERVS